MSVKQHFEYLASYNQWMNAKLYASAAQLPSQVIHDEKGAFFGSIFGTLAHLWRADIIWLKRFAEHFASLHSLEPIRALTHPYDWTEEPYKDLATLRQARVGMDALIVALTVEASEHDYTQQVRYTDSKGGAHGNEFGHLMLHVFNHQTHHRGQVTTLLTQQGIDVGVTDLVMIFPDSATGGTRPSQ